MVNGFRSLTIFAKSFILNFSLASKGATEILFNTNNFPTHLLIYFAFEIFLHII